MGRSRREVGGPYKYDQWGRAIPIIPEPPAVACADCGKRRPCWYYANVPRCDPCAERQ